MGWMTKENRCIVGMRSHRSWRDLAVRTLIDCGSVPSLFEWGAIRIGSDAMRTFFPLWMESDSMPALFKEGGGLADKIDVERLCPPVLQHRNPLWQTISPLRPPGAGFSFQTLMKSDSMPTVFPDGGGLCDKENGDALWVCGQVDFEEIWPLGHS